MAPRCQELTLETAEVESLCRVVQSQLDVSLGGLLDEVEGSSVRRSAGAWFAVVPIGRGQLSVFGVDAVPHHELEQLVDRELLQLGERSASLARILVEPRSFRVERGGSVVAVGAHGTIVGLKTSTTPAGCPHQVNHSRSGFLEPLTA